MNQRLTRKDMKHDDFASAMGRGVEYAESHVRTILYAVAGVLLLVALGVGLYYWRSHQSQDAGQALSKAVKVFQGPVVATGAKPNDPTAPSASTSRRSIPSNRHSTSPIARRSVPRRSSSRGSTASR